MNCTVYKCYKKDDENKDEPFAVKIYSKKEMTSADIDCYNLENRILANVSSQNIIKIQ